MWSSVPIPIGTQPLVSKCGAGVGSVALAGTVCWAEELSFFSQLSEGSLLYKGHS